MLTDLLFFLQAHSLGISSKAIIKDIITPQACLYTTTFWHSSIQNNCHRPQSQSPADCALTHWGSRGSV